MKNKIVFIGIIAFIAVIGFGMTGCDPNITETNQTPVAGDYTFGNLNQTAGSVTAVSITPNEGKSSGAITIYYEGAGSTTYTKNTAIPQTIGQYTVTFDVASVTGWNAATGLSAGTLIVSPGVSNDTYGISLDAQETYTFASFQEGYDIISPHPVIVTNTGNQPTGALTVALSGANAASFTLSTISISSIAVSGDHTFFVNPSHGLPAGTYTATVTVSGGENITAHSFIISFEVTFDQPEPTFGISLNQTDTYHFESTQTGYSAITPITVRIDNTGNQPTGMLTVALSGANAYSFTLSANSIPSIEANDHMTFTVAPNTGLTNSSLPVRTYTATVTVSGDENITAHSFIVSFEVFAAPNFGIGDPSVKFYIDGTLVQGEETTVAQGIGTCIVSIASGTYTEIIWFVNGIKVAEGASRTSITLSRQTASRYQVMVEATPENGDKNSGRHVFNVQSAAVTNITGVPDKASVGIELHLTNIVHPANISFKAISWSLVSGFAVINENILTPIEGGTLIIRATIADGSGNGNNYFKDFSIEVSGGTPYAGEYFGSLFKYDFSQIDLSVTLISNAIIGEVITISNISLGDDNEMLLQGIKLGTWAYIYSNGIKIGIVIDYAVSGIEARQLLLGASIVEPSLSLLSMYGADIDTSDMDDTYQGTLVKM
ncbi:MAG: hypothetical protein FWD13_05085 [Treponema sp.]|nr:hypothetical protein [Treponema sp.]